MDTDAASGSRRRDPEGAHVPRMQERRGRAQQRRTVHGCQEGQALPAWRRVLVETRSQESRARPETASQASEMLPRRARKPASYTFLQ